MSLIAIIGATGTIGSVLARRLAVHGHKVLLVGRNEVQLRSLSEELGQPHLTANPANSRHFEESLRAASIESAIQHAIARSGRMVGGGTASEAVRSGSDAASPKLMSVWCLRPRHRQTFLDFRMSGLILLTGATGYVGGRLLSLLQHQGMYVRCLTRRPETLQDRVNATTEVVRGDVFDQQSVRWACEGVETAYYLVHSMGDNRDFESQDRIAAERFAIAASSAGVRRIIYLGGLGNPDEKLSKHLRSRQETGDVLRAHHSQVIEFRASIVIGSGSLSFEMIRALVERLPIMICPRWVSVKAQPIAIEDLLEYLFAASKLPDSASQVYEIGSLDQVSYGEIMQEYARQRGLRRWMIPVPLLTPYLSSLWLGLVTPLYARVGRKLVESLRNPTLVSNNLAESVFAVRPRSFRDAIARALVNEDQEFAATRWSDAMSSSGRQQSWGGDRYGSRLVDSRTTTVAVPPEQAFAPIRRIGGRTGWYYGNWLWSLRGFLDLVIGGVGIRRGRRDPENLHVGDSLDCWRVEVFELPHRLRLKAELKLPGRAWLEFEVRPAGQGSTIRQTAIFDPLGLAGLLYWYGISPLHQLVFAGMLRNLARAAESCNDGSAPPGVNSLETSVPRVHASGITR